MHWIAATLAGVPFGFATITIVSRMSFTGCFTLTVACCTVLHILDLVRSVARSTLSMDGYLLTLIHSTSQTYTIYASSSGACNIFARCMIGSFFPIVAHSVIDNLGSEWGGKFAGFESSVACVVSWPLSFFPAFH